MNEKTTFTAKNGKKYIFDVYDIDKNTLDDKSPDESGIYIFAKRKPETLNKNKYVPIYVGQSENCEERHKRHHKEDDIIKQEPDCMCFLKERDKDERLRIEAELIEALDPICNG